MYVLGANGSFNGSFNGPLSFDHEGPRRTLPGIRGSELNAIHASLQGNRDHDMWRACKTLGRAQRGVIMRQAGCYFSGLMIQNSPYYKLLVRAPSQLGSPFVVNLS